MQSGKNWLVAEGPSDCLEGPGYVPSPEAPGPLAWKNVIGVASGRLFVDWVEPLLGVLKATGAWRGWNRAQIAL